MHIFNSSIPKLATNDNFLLTGTDSINILPSDVLGKVFFYITNANELKSVATVNIIWNKVFALDLRLGERLKLFRNNINIQLWFDCIQKARITGKKIDKAFSILPDNINEILDHPCPIVEGKRIRETHTFLYIPASIDDLEITPTFVGELAETKLPSPRSPRKNPGYFYIWEKIISDLNQTEKSCWILMFKDVIGGMDLNNGSRNKSFSAQKEMIDELRKNSGLPYKIPTARKAIIAIQMHYIKTGERLFTHSEHSGNKDKPVTYTRCIENINNFQIAIGGFVEKNGLQANNFSTDASNGIGITCFLEFQ